MPSRVRWFVVISLLTVTLGVAWLAAFHTEFEGMSSARIAPELISTVIAVAYGSQIALYAIQMLLVWLIAFRRKNWARWVLLVTTMVVDLPFVGQMLSPHPGMPFQTQVFGASILMDTIALYLIFTGNARPWFRKQAVT